MANTDRGAALLAGDLAPTSMPRAYSIGLSYESGYGVPVGVNPGWFTAIDPSISDLVGIRTNTDRPALVKPDPVDQGEASDTENSDGATAGYDWFGAVHILPRARIEFGNIITQESEDYEIYNAYRNYDCTLGSVTNNVAPGVALPDLATPIVIPAQTSVLDPTTTGNLSDTIELGSMVKLSVVAEQDGLPLFDDAIIFNIGSPANSPYLLLSGQRIVLVPMVWETPFIERLGFLTDIITASDGKEQRISLRKMPRQRFEITYRLDENERQRMQALLMEWTDRVWALPLWHEQLRLTDPVSPGATTYQVSGADGVDFRVGGLGVVITDNNTYDVLNITAVTDSQITANDPSANGYPAGTPIIPVRTVIMEKATAGVRYKTDVEDFRAVFQVLDNTTGAPTGSTTPGWWSTYDSKVLLDDPNIFGGTMGQEFPRNIRFVDNSTGVPSVSSMWSKYKHTSFKGFSPKTREEIMQLRRLLFAMRGKAVSFYIPTFANDLTVAANLSVGASTMLVERIEYTRLIANREPKATFRITFTDDTSLVRTVTDSEVYSGDSTLELLTLNTSWPAGRTVDEIVRVEFYELTRFDTDDFTIEYEHVGKARCTAPLKTVFDE